MSAEEYKNLGSTAWRENKFSEAVTNWTQAIELSTATDKDFLKVIYSNRSAAYLKLGQPSAALIDGEKCIQIDQHWAKVIASHSRADLTDFYQGYTRKGDALHALLRYVDAFNAYNAGARVAAADEKTGLQSKAEQMMRLIRKQDSSNDSSASTDGQTNAPAGSLATAQKYLRFLILGNLLLYLLPIGRGIPASAAKVFAVISAINQVISIYSRHGMIQLNMTYASSVLTDSTSMGLFLSFLLLSSKPYLLAMLPIALTEITHFTAVISQV